MGFHGILEPADKMFFRGLEYKDIVAIINPANPFSFGLFQWINVLTKRRCLQVQYVAQYPDTSV